MIINSIFFKYREGPGTSIWSSCSNDGRHPTDCVTHHHKNILWSLAWTYKKQEDKVQVWSRVKINNLFWSHYITRLNAFSDYGATQISLDFTSLRNWISKNENLKEDSRQDKVSIKDLIKIDGFRKFLFLTKRVA